MYATRCMRELAGKRMSSEHSARRRQRCNWSRSSATSDPAYSLSAPLSNSRWQNIGHLCFTLCKGTSCDNMQTSGLACASFGVSDLKAKERIYSPVQPSRSTTERLEAHPKDCHATALPLRDLIAGEAWSCTPHADLVTDYLTVCASAPLPWTRCLRPMGSTWALQNILAGRQQSKLKFVTCGDSMLKT